MSLSSKQQLVMEMELPRMTILEGAISSGKTFIGNHKAIKHLVNNYRGDGLVFFIGKTMDTLERNILHPLEQAYGQSYFTYRKGAKKANLCGIPIELEGCNDIRAEAKIRGTTAEFIYGDELTLWNEAFMTRCMGSLRTPNAKFIGTTNPDVPSNFIKTGWLDRKDELDLTNIKFEMEDNPSLTPEYIREVQKEYQGVYHDRFIKGLWVRAEGIIYRLFADNPERYIIDTAPEDIRLIQLGVDFGGNKSNSTFTATGFTRGYEQVVVLDEELRRAATDDPEKLGKAWVEFCRRIMEQYPGVSIKAFGDSAEQLLIRGLNNATVKAGIPIRLTNAYKGSIVGRIRLTSMLMAQDRLQVMRHCGELTESFKQAVWDEKELEDVRLDDHSYNVDSLDSFEYSIENRAGQLGRSA